MIKHDAHIQIFIRPYGWFVEVDYPLNSAAFWTYSTCRVPSSRKVTALFDQLHSASLREELKGAQRFLWEK